MAVVMGSLCLLFLLAFLILPFFCREGGSGPSVAGFCLHVTFDRGFHGYCELMLLSTLLVFRFCRLSLFGLPLRLTPSSIMYLLLFSRQVSRQMFHFLRRRQALLKITMFSIIYLFTPRFLPLNIAVNTLVFKTTFCPSLSIYHVMGGPFLERSFLRGPRDVVPRCQG